MAVNTCAAEPVVREMRLYKRMAVVYFYAVVYTIVITFVALAIDHLSDWHWTPVEALVSSVLWLALIALVTITFCWEEGGPWQYVLNRVARLFGSSIAQTRSDGEVSTLRLGHLLFGLRWFTLEVDISGITMVRWAEGQGSAGTGKDMNDWTVAVWFDKDAVRMSKARPTTKRSGDDLRIVGHDGPRNEVEAFGYRFVEFLRDAGALLTSTEDGTKFVRKECVMVSDEDAGAHA